MTTDPFTVLGADENASDDDIKQRYLALVRNFPPDREPERFQAYRAAFEALSTERGRLAAKLLRSHGAALSRIEMASLPPPEARRNARVTQAQLTTLLVEGVSRALARSQEAARGDVSKTGGAA